MIKGEVHCTVHCTGYTGVVRYNDSTVPNKGSCIFDENRFAVVRGDESWQTILWR